MSASKPPSQFQHSHFQSLTLRCLGVVLIYGDPNDGDPVGSIPSSKVKIICHEGDNICEGGILVLPPHTNYQIDANAGAQFIASKV